GVQIFFEFRCPELVKRTLCDAKVRNQLVATDFFVSFYIRSPLLGCFLPGFCLALLNTCQNLRISINQLLRLLVSQVKFSRHRLEFLQRFCIQLYAFGSLKLVLLRRTLWFIAVLFFILLIVFRLFVISRFIAISNRLWLITFLL